MIVVVCLGTAVLAVTSVLAIRGILRQDYRDAGQARTVIAAAQLGAAAERLVVSTRGFLITGNPRTRELIAARTADVRRRLGRLIRSSGPATRGRVAEVEDALREYVEVAESIMWLRGPDRAGVERVFEDQLQPRRAALELTLRRLFDAEEADLDALEHAGQASASMIATVASGVALAALIVALVLGILLARAFESVMGQDRELRRAKARLESANRDLEAFAVRIAHDLRTPLTPIPLLAGSLQRGFGDTPVAQIAARICDCAQRAGDLVERLLSFSRPGRFDTFALADATQIARDALDQFGPQADALGARIERQLQPDTAVACAAPLFRQVLDNLVGNALQHLSGRDRRLVTVRLTALGGKVRLEVEDTGPGIPEESLRRTFDPHYRAPAAVAPGIGLATVRRIVDAHGGEAGVSSRLGAGTVFRIDLPARRWQENELPSRSAVDSVPPAGLASAGSRAGPGTGRA
jgi:signal transduction histidine kinase